MKLPVLNSLPSHHAGTAKAQTLKGMVLDDLQWYAVPTKFFENWQNQTA